MSPADQTLHSPVFELARGITDSAFVLDCSRNILEFNRALARLHSIERKKVPRLKGTHCRDCVKMEICEGNCIVLKCLESQATVRFDEVTGVTASGESLKLIVTAIPVRDPSGAIVAVLEIHRDVTDEAKIHEKYKVFLEKEKRAKEELERLVAERTKELQQANEELKRKEVQLIHSEKMSSLGQMVAGIAHELNNPINFIYGNVESIDEYCRDVKEAVAKFGCLFDGNEDLRAAYEKIRSEQDLDFIFEDFAKVVQSIRNGSERAAEIIKGLRTFSRLDEAQLKEVDIHEGIDTTLTLLRNKYKNRIEIHKEFGNIGLVICYSSQLNQVFMNLIHNATQAIRKEGDVWIRTKDAGDDVVVEIEDNGCGIPKEVRAKIFDPFFTTKEVGEGTGLGLSITYSIIERHGGTIVVESEVGKGTKFIITIPKQSKPQVSEEGDGA